MTTEVRVFALFKLLIIMKYLSWIILVLMTSTTYLQAQRDDMLLQRERKAYAQRSIKELKSAGVMVLRLKTNHRQIKQLEKTLAHPDLSPSKRKRHQELLDYTITTRDSFNHAFLRAFHQVFDFCPVLVVYDTCTQDLLDGVRSGIFLDKNGQLDPNIGTNAAHIFIVNYKKKSAEFPFDILRIRRLEEKLAEPFPYYVSIRASWINNINTTRAANSVGQLNRKLHTFYQRVLVYEEKQAAKAAKAANQ